MELIAPFVLALLFIVFGLSHRGNRGMRCDGCPGTGDCQGVGDCQQR